MTAGHADWSLEASNAWIPAVSFDDLYRQEYAPMVRLARSLVDGDGLAEELVQDAFVSLYERWDRLREPGAYLRTAVVNRARSELRKRAVRRRIGIDRRPEAVPGEQDYLIDALDRLSPKRRTALVLRFYAQLPEKEIAVAMDVRPGTVKSLVSRGLADLRKVIQQ